MAQGSFDTWEGGALFGKTIKWLEVAAYLNYRNTEGFRGHVEQDQQSMLDSQYGTHASLAPGSMKGDLYEWDAQLTMKYDGLKFDGKYINIKRDEPFGFRPILDNTSYFGDRDYYLNLSYDTTITEGLDFMVKAYRNQNTIKIHNQIFDKGSLILTPTGPMMTSVDRFVESWNKSSRMGAEAQVTYEIVDSNTLVGGITFEQQESYDNKGRGNIRVTPNPYVFIVLPSVQDTPPGLPNPDVKRDVWAAYVEDIWDILDNLRLTIGGRYDHYSDFGGQFSPRLGINWEFAENFNTKFLYGQSFRAPYFLDLYDSTWGNPNLKSETQETFELSLGARFHPFSAQITAFRDKVTDSINVSVVGSPPTYKYINGQRATRTGAELQLKYDFGRGTYLSASLYPVHL
jgi:outer membrane receptor protein involved in Fe transport